MKATELTTKQILAMCDFAGIEYKQPHKSELDAVYYLKDEMEISTSEGLYVGLGITSDYPEGGAMPLENNNG
ncbi:hypothetical protein [Xenorhabdus szentirmaii]|uniref:hypothetical protein n=1 Tax=Xenorhabdus szentirmaii TaxID=290112 RepID=UPI00199F17B5|nr:MULTISPECIES: hypothetical protein [unclassified Xenorhabdus]MBD2791727.1 hypothetical protein [Xenorhabdus sp. CUL]MBD2827142.1 hypothetical protein [Xenorhabdus sp. 5]